MKNGKIALMVGLMLLMSSFFVSADTEITNCGEINVSDNYFLSDDLITNQALENCIEITADNVNIDCSDFVFENINSNEATTLFYVANQENINIDNCNIKNYDTGIYMDDVRNSFVRNSTFEGYYNAINIGYAFDDGNSLEVSGNTFLSKGRALRIDSYQNYTDSELVIQNNNFYSNFYPIRHHQNESQDFHIFGNFFLGYTLCENEIDPLLLVCDNERVFTEAMGFDPGNNPISYLVDETPYQCENGWDGESDYCQISKYESEDLSKIFIDGMGTFGVEFLKLVALIVVLLIIGYVGSVIKYKMMRK